MSFITRFHIESLIAGTVLINMWYHQTSSLTIVDTFYSRLVNNKEIFFRSTWGTSLKYERKFLKIFSSKQLTLINWRLE